MKLKKTAILTVAVLLAILVLAGSMSASASPEERFAEGQKLMEKARLADRDNKPLERDELYQRAIKELRKAGGGSGLYTGAKVAPVDAARARLMIAEALENSGITEKEHKKSLSKALLEYKSIESAYKMPLNKLRARYGSDAAAIQEVSNEASTRHQHLAAEIDEMNSTHPLYKLMDFLVALTGRKPGLSYWLAILLITVIVKTLITPLTKAQFKGMRQMQAIQPLVKELQDKYKGDQKELGEKVMGLYKEHGINPFASCLPLMVQLPILWFLYFMIRMYEYQFALGTFLWISPTLGDKFAWIASNLAQPDIPLVILYTISMVISMRLSNVDPTQAQQQKMMSIYMPILFAFLFKSFPSAFLLYWLVFNILTTVQQYFIIHGHQEPAPVNAASSPQIAPSPSGEVAGVSATGSQAASRRRRRRK